MLRRIYDLTMGLAAGRHAERALAAIAFIESSIFPIPPDALLVPMVLAKPESAWRYATISTVASVLGGLAGYLIGAFLFETVARPVLAFYGYLEQFDEFAALYNRWGLWIVLVAGLTPFPYKVVTIASGATGLSLPVFAIASVIARGGRFFAVAWLLHAFGPPVRAFIEKRLGLVFAASLALLLGGFVVARYLA